MNAYRFQRKTNLINVVALTDGTHIDICKPKDDGDDFYQGRKKNFTTNC